MVLGNEKKIEYCYVTETSEEGREKVCCWSLGKNVMSEQQNLETKVKRAKLFHRSSTCQKS